MRHAAKADAADAERAHETAWASAQTAAIHVARRQVFGHVLAECLSDFGFFSHFRLRLCDVLSEERS